MARTSPWETVTYKDLGEPQNHTKSSNRALGAGKWHLGPYTGTGSIKGATAVSSNWLSRRGARTSVTVSDRPTSDSRKQELASLGGEKLGKEWRASRPSRLPDTLREV